MHSRIVTSLLDLVGNTPLVELQRLCPKEGVRIYAAEVETAAPLAASMAAGEPRIVDYQPSFVDGIGSKMVFPNMFAHARKLLDGSLVVSLAEAAAAMKLVAERNRVIIEGASACAVGRLGNDFAFFPQTQGFNHTPLEVEPGGARVHEGIGLDGTRFFAPEL